MKTAKMVTQLAVLWILLAVSAFNGSEHLLAQTKKRPPNIIFIKADDLGWQDVGFMGSQYFETPNLDRLAKKSAVFERSYMYPTCSPSRAALLTGRQSVHTGVFNVPVLERKNSNRNVYSRWTVTLDHPLYSDFLKKAGYQLAHFGKWHIVGPYPKRELNSYPFSKKLKQPRTGDLSWLEAHRRPDIQKYYPTGRGFDKNVGGSWWGDPSRGHSKGYQSKSGGFIAPFENPFIEPKENDRWLTDRLTNEAISFMKRNREKPFFINLHYYAPHRPSKHYSTKRFQYYLKKDPDQATGQGTVRKKEIANYATMVESIDINVHRVVESVRRLGLEENTLIVFTSDNGFNSLQSINRNLRGSKGTIYEGGIRVPTLVYWPSKVKPNRTKVPICGWDFFPTFLDLAGIKDKPKNLDGVSILPLLFGGKWKDRSIFWHIASEYKHPACSAIRKGNWKLIQYLVDGRTELYNLKNDPKESKNLADTETEVHKKLKKELIDWRAKNNAPLPTASRLPR